MNNITFPKEFIRGISNKDFIFDGQILPSAFHFEDQGREDKMLEASINWLDDNEAIIVALRQKKDNGKFQFPAGLAKLNLEKVKFFLKGYVENGFSYERAPIEGNQYHGNLLLDSSIDKKIRHIIMNGLALAAETDIIPPCGGD